MIIFDRINLNYYAMKTFSLFILTLLFSTFSISQEYKTLTSDGKLKKGRTILSGLITTIPEGTKVEIVYKSYEKGHYRVLYKNLNGYIHERHFKPTTTPVTEQNLVKGHVIFREDFNNNKNNWTEHQQASKAYYFKNGAYFIAQRDNGRLTWEAKSVEIDTQSDFSIESSITLHERNNGGAHLLFGMDETNRSYHSIKIKNEKGKKEVFIGKYVNGQWIGAWSDGFINEFGKPNLIQITKRGEEISFYVNGLFIERRRFEPFFGNAIALGCEGVQTSSFDYLSVQQGGLHIEAPNTTPVAPKKVASFNSIAKVKLRSYNGVYTLPAMLNDALEVYATYEEGATDITIG